MNSTKCSVENCNRDPYKKNIECILHCEKGNYDIVFREQGQSFYNELVDYVAEEVLRGKTEAEPFYKNDLQLYLLDGEDQSNGVVSKGAKNAHIGLVSIVFPESRVGDSFDYLQVLEKIGEIQFRKCKFRTQYLELKETKCLYANCDFPERWSICNTQTIGGFDGVLYQTCIFHENVDIDPDNRVIDNSLFYNCEFQKNIEFYGVEFEMPVFRNKAFKSKIGEFNVKNCHFQEKLTLNDHEIEKFHLKDSIFDSKFEFVNNTVGDFKVFNTNFKEIVETHGTKFKKFSIRKSIFNEYVGFERCEFGVNDEKDNSFIAVFEYATFLRFVNFRATEFKSGLDIERVNFKEAPNFLNIRVNPSNANRETFRIIKNSFDKIGNHIEANKFFADEMKKYKEELKDSGITQKRVVFWLNEKISNFGQSYIKPICWIIVVSVIYYLLMRGYENNILYIFPPANNIIGAISGLFNSVAENILPFKKFLKDGMEFISLLFYIIFAVLIWQTIVAVKRHTRR